MHCSSGAAKQSHDVIPEKIFPFQESLTITSLYPSGNLK